MPVMWLAMNYLHVAQVGSNCQAKTFSKPANCKQGKWSTQSNDRNTKDWKSAVNFVLVPETQLWQRWYALHQWLSYQPHPPKTWDVQRSRYTDCKVHQDSERADWVDIPCWKAHVADILPKCLSQWTRPWKYWNWILACPLLQRHLQTGTLPENYRVKCVWWFCSCDLQYDGLLREWCNTQTFHHQVQADPDNVELGMTLNHTQTQPTPSVARTDNCYHVVRWRNGISKTHWSPQIWQWQHTLLTLQMMIWSITYSKVIGIKVCLIRTHSFTGVGTSMGRRRVAHFGSSNGTGCQVLVSLLSTSDIIGNPCPELPNLCHTRWWCQSEEIPYHMRRFIIRPIDPAWKDEQWCTVIWK